MIVRNEGTIIERCLTAALPVIDAAVLCDTGSTDATPVLARDYLSRRGVPFRICHHPWKNFGENRTAAITEARRFVNEMDWPVDRTYWLFLDADLELMGGAQFDRASLAADALALRQRSETLSHWNLRLARASLDWAAVGRTHERYRCPEQPAFTRLSSLWIRDYGDGGSKANKLRRDIAWLSEQVTETPADSRAVFYLAQSYRAMGDAMKALLLYRRRAAFADDHEEVWYSKFCMGTILADAGHVDAARAALMDAHAADPERAEPCYELSKLHLRQNEVDEAIAFADRGRAAPVPWDRAFFVHADVYEHGLDLQLARAAVGTPHAGRGFDACEAVALSRSVPRAAIESARRLEARYAAPLEGVEYLPICPELPAPYRACNPSILRTATGFLVVCRGVNYEQRRLRYRALDDDGIYRTRNVLRRLDDAFVVLEAHDIEFDEPPARDARVRGLEDCRLVAVGDAICFTCVTADRHPSGFVHQSICRIDSQGRVLSHRPLIGPFDRRHQKNWLPFAGADGVLRAIYGYDPLTVLRLSVESGAYEVERQVESSVNAGCWRGSGGPVLWPDGRGRQIVLVHEVVHRQGPDSGWERVYLHRFIEYDPAFRLMRVSRPFVFAHKGVEFVCGMAPGPGGADLVIALGVEDREAYLARIPFARIDRLLDDRLVG